MNFKEIEGNIITESLLGKFDVIAHGCNCFCTMGAGLAPQMAKVFGCDKFPMEDKIYTGDINKLGNIDYQKFYVDGKKAYNVNQYQASAFPMVTVINAYSQYGFGRNHKNGTDSPVDYEAITMIMRKIDKIFEGQHIGLPMIGAGLAGGDWDLIKSIIIKELKNCDVTIVIYKP